MMSDLRSAVRQLLRNPGLSAVVVVTLALGIGANATVLTWVGNLLLRPLPGAADQGHVVALVSNVGGGNISLLDSRDFDALRPVFSGVAVSQITPAFMGDGGSEEWVYGQVASANFFELLGVRPLLGRTFLPDEDRTPGANPVIVLGESLWRRRFGADPAVVGRTVRLNRHPFTVAGVVPAEFRGTMTGLSLEFWAPVSMNAVVRNQHTTFLDSRDSRGFHNVARLQPGVSVAQAQAAVAALDERLAGAYPETNRTARHRVVPYSRCPYGAQAVLGPALRLLLAVSLGVLLIVAANVANLLSARAVGRRRELAVRMAAGATRWRVIRQLVTESVLLALIGGAAGALLATQATGAILAFVPTTQMPVAIERDLSVLTLGLTLLLTLATGLGVGLIPALQVSSPRLAEALKESGRANTGSVARSRVRGTLVVIEVAVALVLLVGAGLCFQGLKRASRIDPGFDPERVLVGGLQIGMNGYTQETAKAFYRRLQERAGAIPGVEEAALASWFPLGLAGNKGWGVRVPGYEPRPDEDLVVEYTVVSPRYFATLRIPLVAGRDFADTDDGAAAAVAIVNEHFAARFWPGQDPIGRRFRSVGTWLTVVGVARAGKYNRLDEAAWPVFYLPYQQFVPDLDLSVCLRTRAEQMGYAGALRDAVHSVDPGVELTGTMPLTAHCSGALYAQRTASALTALLGLVGLLLAAMGVYSVMAHSVGTRTQEFGIRIALGAQRGEVLRLVLRQGLTLARAGVVIGLVASLAVTRALSAFLFGVSPFDPLTFAAGALVLTGVALVACWLPARRATRVDPVVALRSE